MLEIDQIYLGDCLQVMKDIEDKSVDLIVTDPPYGYSFMGKDWDKAVIGVDYWRECLRVLKDGAFAFVMSSPRQDVLSRMIVNLQDAGFEIGFTSIYWCYASGFPKASNISKMVDKRLGAEREVVGKNPNWRPSQENYSWGDGQLTPQIINKNITIPSTDEAKALDGSYGGFQPKPALEVVLVVMKPLSEKTFVDQALSNGHGVTWLNDVRIPCDNKRSPEFKQPKSKGQFGNTDNSNLIGWDNSQGRFPANLLVSDDILNDGVDRKTGWDDKDNISSLMFGSFKVNGSRHFNDSGSFSRFFSLDSWWDNRIKQLPESVQKTFPFMIIPKASKAEKNKGCEDLPEKRIEGRDIGQDERNVPHKHRVTSTTNVHPCVKPIKLFSYLITLGSREGDLVLDPFVGSGTSCISAKMLDRRFIGIEKESEYFNIAQKRVAEAISVKNSQPELF